MSIQNSVVFRKLTKWSMSYCKRLLPHPNPALPPVLVNSVPKSGTHLLYQLFENDPAVKDFGEFLASTPSVTQRELSAAKMVRRIERLRRGELFRGHLFHDDGVVQALCRMNVVHFFIYRDPRDVVCSEAHYLATMNRWHRMHRRFAGFAEAKDRIALSIDGIGNGSTDPYFPDINVRYRRYLPWMYERTVCAVKFEDLVGVSQVESVRRIMTFYGAAKGESPSGIESHVATAMEQINPTRSHTFRKGGGVRTWERHFDERLKERFKEVAGPLLIELGYERDLNW